MTEEGYIQDLAERLGLNEDDIANIINCYIKAVTGEFVPLTPLSKPRIDIRPVKIKTLKERLNEAYYQKEDDKMKATSTENFHDVIAIDFELQTFPNPDVNDKFIVSATNRDDIFCFVFEGPHIADACRKAGLFTSWGKEQKIRELEKDNKKLEEEYENKLDNIQRKYEDALRKKDELDESLGRWKKEAADCLRLRDEAQKEAYKLKKENEKYEEKIKKLERADMLDKGAADYWSKEHDTLLERFRKLQNENEELKSKNKDSGLKEDFKHEITKFAKENVELKKEISKLKNTAKKGDYIIYNGMPYMPSDIERLLADIRQLEELKTPTIENFADEKPSTRADILDQAKKCVCGQREQDYGTPESNFQLIADLWNTYLGFTSYVLELEEYLMDLKDKGIDIDIDVPEPKAIFPEDVAMMMALLKIARIKNGGGSGDSFVDLAGYAACGGEIWAGEKKNKDQK